MKNSTLLVILVLQAVLVMGIVAAVAKENGTCVIWAAHCHSLLSVSVSVQYSRGKQAGSYTGRHALDAVQISSAKFLSNYTAAVPENWIWQMTFQLCTPVVVIE